MAKVLSDDEVTAALADLPHWSGDGTGIRRTVTVQSFLAGIALVDEVARAAEAADHHPDIDIRWRDVTFALVTHSAGGVTRRDLEMARTVDSIISG